ncbi:hypothetical protein ASE79_13290 [Sphingomonas sp. Leaf28]|nr:hypothetical protein ASE79_13290 [Sphingomonas sp. Leaf28]
MLTEIDDLVSLSSIRSTRRRQDSHALSIRGTNIQSVAAPSRLLAFDSAPQSVTLALALALALAQRG